MRRVSIAVAAAAIVAIFTSVNLAQTAPPLFEGGVAALADARIGAVRSRSVRINQALLGGTDGQLAPALRMRLNLFPETEFVARLEQFEQTGSGYAWVGRIEGEPLADVILVTVDGVVRGSVTLPGRSYAIRAENGVEVVNELDDRLFSRGDDDVVVPPRGRAPGLPVHRQREASDDGSVIDLAVVYSNTARRDAESEADLLAAIDLAVTRTNLAFRNSGVHTRLRQVHTGPVDYEDRGALLVDLERAAEGGIPGLHRLRDDTGSDLVLLITGNKAGWGGIAYLNWPDADGAYGYSLSTLDALFHPSVVAHELGHNLGAQHNWYSDADGGAFPFSHGHVDLQGRFLTIMSYWYLCQDAEVECTKLQGYYSTPAVLSDGRPVGVPEGTNRSCTVGNLDNPRCDADNARTFNAMAPVIANFRPSRTPPPPAPATLDFTCHGYDEGATRAYNCIPNPDQQYHMRAFVPPVGSPCNEGTIDEFPPGRIVFQIRCTNTSGGSAAGTSLRRFQMRLASARTTPPTLDFTCHRYEEGATRRAYNCIPKAEQQHHMRTFVPPVGSPCDQGTIDEFPPGRIVFQIRCKAT